MPLAWTPDPATAPWNDVQEDEVWTAPPITAVDATGLLVVTGYSCQVTGPAPLDGLLAVQTDATGVTLSAPNGLPGVFAPIDIEYQIKGVTGHCATFGQLPAQADEVIRFQPNPVNVKDWTVHITAHSAGGDASADFILRVRANYTPGRDALKEAVNARRR